MTGAGREEAQQQPAEIKIVLQIFLCASVLFALTGCGGFGGGLIGRGVDFSLSVSPGSQTVTAGNLVAYTVAVHSNSGLAPIVQLSVSGLPAGATASFNDSAVTVQGSSTLDILTDPRTPAGTIQFTITGSDPTGKQSVTAMMTIQSGPPPLDFIVSVTPGTRTTLGGGSVDYTVFVTSDNVAPVNLAVTGLPAGATATLAPPSITGRGKSTLTIVTQNPTAPGFYGLNVVGTDPTGTQKVPVNLNIPSVDFTLDQHTGPSSVIAGGNIVGTITATPILGPLPTVNLSVVAGLPPGVSASFSPPTLGGASTSSDLMLTTTTSTAPGIYQITVQASDASGIQTAQVPFVVITGNPAAGFFLSANPSDAEVMAGGQAFYTILVSNNAGPVPAVTFSLSGLPLNSAAGITPGPFPNSFVLSVSTDPLSDRTAASIIITATGPSGTQQIFVGLTVDATP